MEEVLLNFITAVRRAGVRVSVSETMDAMRAAAIAGPVDRELFKGMLSVSMAKSVREKTVFEECFEKFFSPAGYPGPGADIGRSGSPEPSDGDSPLTGMLLAGDRAGLSMAMMKAAEQVDVGSIRFFTQQSLYVRRIMEMMGSEGLDRDIRRSSPEEEKNRFLKEAKGRLFEMVKDLVEKRYSIFARHANEEVIRRFLKNISLSNVERQDFERMKILVRQMVKKLNDRHSRRRKRARKGRLDFKKTLRKNACYQGFFFEPHWKTRKKNRPEIVALCDVSRSVEAYARFMLLFLYGLSEQVAVIRSFIFCSNLVEVSHIFKRYPVDEAVERLQRGIDLDIMLGRTDYGRALEDFASIGLDRITRRTTVIILGDGRNNYNDPRTDVVKLIQERSKRLLWLNPEPPPFWSTGDSEMKRYKPYCFRIMQCGTLAQLERVVDYLLQTPA